MQATTKLMKWAEVNNLGPWVSVATIREIIADCEGLEDWQSDEEVEELRNVVIQIGLLKKVKEVKEAMDMLTSMANRGEQDTLVQGMIGQHPYLLNELIWTLLKATKLQCGRGQWDGRIAPPLQSFIDEYVVVNPAKV